MGRSPCCDEVGLKKGPWTPEEDKMLVDYIKNHGHGSWRNLPKSAGLNRCGKSCRLRWTNYLRPDIKRGKFSEEEERLIIHLHSILGNKWSAMATRLPGRTDNEIKNYWNTHLKKKLLLMGIDPVTHRRRTDIDILANLCNLANPWDNALILQADAVHSARVQILQGLVQVLASGSPNMDAVNLFGSTSSIGNYQFNDLIQLNHQLEGLINGTLRLNSGLPNLGIQQLPNKFQAYPESHLGQQGHEMVAQINGSCLNDLAMECQGGVANQMVSSYTSPAVNPAPSLVSASPENLTTDRMQEPINSNDVSPNSSASTPLDAWEGLNLGDPNTDLCWKDILDQISWSSTS